MQIYISVTTWSITHMNHGSITKLFLSGLVWNLLNIHIFLPTRCHSYLSLLSNLRRRWTQEKNTSRTTLNWHESHAESNHLYCTESYPRRIKEAVNR